MSGDEVGCVFVVLFFALVLVECRSCQHLESIDTKLSPAERQQLDAGT